MRRSYEEVQELAAARVQDYVAGEASEYVLKASLVALGIDRDDVNFLFWKAQTEKLRTHGALLTPKERAQ